MIVLLASVPLEECTGLLQQVWDHGQVNLGMPQVRVPKINGEMIDQPLHIGFLTVPIHQPMDGEGVPKPVESWLLLRTVGASKVRALSEPLECTLHRMFENGPPLSGDEEVTVSTR
jgi:hypothetical protein